MVPPLFASASRRWNPLEPGSVCMSDKCLQGRVVILTGGAGLLGQHHTSALSAAGAHVVVADLDYERASQVAESNDGAIAVAVDVCEPGSVRKMVERVLAQFGRIDGLVNNAAIDPKFDRSHSGAHANAF